MSLQFYQVGSDMAQEMPDIIQRVTKKVPSLLYIVQAMQES